MNALVLRAGALGDVILTLPVFATLRDRGFRTTAAVSRAFGPFLQELGGFDAHLPLDGEALLPLFSGTDSREAAAILEPFDLVLAYGREGEPLERTLRKTVPPEHLIIQPPPPANAATHATDFLLAPLIPPPPFTRIPRLFLDTWKPACVLIHPGSGSPAKNWPVDRFADLASSLRPRIPVRILLGPAEQDRHELLRLCARPDELIRSLTFATLKDALSEAAVFVGNDAGTTHLAAACGVPVVAIFGPTDPAVWGPRGPFVKILHGRVSCAPCTPAVRAGCRWRRCLEAVSVPAVVTAIEWMMKGAHGKTGGLHQ